MPNGFRKNFVLNIIGRISVDGACARPWNSQGETILNLPMADHLSMASSPLKRASGIFAPDAITEEYVKPRARRLYRIYASDADAVCCSH